MKLHILLVRPKNEKNIAQVARLMANFSCDELHLVSPRKYIPCEDPKSVARNGYDLLQSAHEHRSLEEALSNMQHTFAFTSAEDRDIEKKIELKVLVKSKKFSGNVALVFGPEESGLSKEELFLCSQAVVIPTSKTQSSLNLAQAVGIVLYEFYNYYENIELDNKPMPSFDELRVFDSKLKEAIEKVGFSLNGNSDLALKLLSQSLKRAEPSQRELRLWLSFLDRLS